MTRQPDRTIRPGARVIDGRGTETVRGNTGLPVLCDPREWTRIEWDGARGLKVARLDDLITTGTTP